MSTATASGSLDLFIPSGTKVQKDLHIAEYTDPEHNPMIPHVIVLEPRLVIYKVYNGVLCTNLSETVISGILGLYFESGLKLHFHNLV